MKNILLLLICFCFYSIPLVAQKTLLEKAEFHLAIEQTDSAIYYYKLALKQDLNNQDLKAKLANIYRMTNHPKEAVLLFKELCKSSESDYILNYWWYAYCLKMSGKYRKSRKILAFIKTMDYLKNETAIISNIDQAINSCNFAIQNKQKKRTYTIQNEQMVNSSAADFAPIFYQKNIYFASKRIIKTAHGYSDPNTDFIYVANRKNNGQLDSMRPLHDATSFNIFFQSNFAPFSISKDGKTIFCSYNLFGATVRHPYIADLKEATDASAFEMNYQSIDNLTKLLSTMSTLFPYFARLCGFPHLSADGKTLYFSGKNLPGISYGGYDLYVCYLENGTWSTPTNLGPNINTFADEISPFVDEEGILYFASDAHLGFGGFDIFSSVQKKGIWQKPSNLGVPVNSAQDDLYFIFDTKNGLGYFSSNRKGGKGGYDLYSLKKKGK